MGRSRKFSAGSPQFSVWRSHIVARPQKTADSSRQNQALGTTNLLHEFDCYTSLICYRSWMFLAGVRIPQHSWREVRFHFFGHGQCLLDARADGRAAQVISGQEKAREARQVVSDSSKPFTVAEVVLRKRAQPNRGAAEPGRILDGKQGSEFALNDTGKLFG